MRPLALSVALAFIVVLTGCVPSGEPVGPPPEPTFEPVFASDEEALAAAEEAYAEYLRVLDDGFITGETEGLPGVVVGAALASATTTLSEFAEAGKTQTGRTSAENVRLVTHDANGWVQIYACLNVSKVAMFDAGGKSLVASDRPIHYPVQVDLVLVDTQLLVEAEQVWNGHDFCK